MFQRSSLLLVLTFTFGVGLVCLGAYLGITIFQLTKYGVEAEATIVGRENPPIGRTGRTMEERLRYVPRSIVRFTTKDGITIQGKIEPPFWKRLLASQTIELGGGIKVGLPQSISQIGEKLTVRYLPSNPGYFVSNFQDQLIYVFLAASAFLSGITAIGLAIKYCFFARQPSPYAELPAYEIVEELPIGDPIDSNSVPLIPIKPGVMYQTISRKIQEDGPQKGLARFVRRRGEALYWDLSKISDSTERQQAYQTLLGFNEEDELFGPSMRRFMEVISRMSK